MTGPDRSVPALIGAAEMAEIDRNAEKLGLPTVARAWRYAANSTHVMNDQTSFGSHPQ